MYVILQKLLNKSALPLYCVIKLLPDKEAVSRQYSNYFRQIQRTHRDFPTLETPFLSSESFQEHSKYHDRRDVGKDPN